MRIALHNLGCKVNLYETQSILKDMAALGFEAVPFSAVADIYIINTCAVTNMAARKSRQLVHRARKLNPSAVVAAIGCYAEAEGERLVREGAADICIGNERKKEAAAIIAQFVKKRNAIKAADAILGQEAKASVPVRGNPAAGIVKGDDSLSGEHGIIKTRAFLKIEDGCDNFCTYCIIPTLRGRIRSRDEDDIVSEAERLAASGFKEIVLTGICLSAYGRMTGDGLGGVAAHRASASALVSLIARLSELNGIERIRLGSLEPGIITEESAAQLASCPKLCPHFHMSLQSGCDTVLKRMGRRYTVAQYAQKCAILRAAFDRPAITTDIITGFPGETKEEFARTLGFLEGLGLYMMHVFKYSKRAGTPAAAMKDQIPENIKAQRSRTLISLSKRNEAAFVEQFRGSCQQILIEEVWDEKGTTMASGNTERYMRWEGELPKAQPGRMAWVRF